MDCGTGSMEENRRADRDVAYNRDNDQREQIEKLKRQLEIMTETLNKSHEMNSKLHDELKACRGDVVDSYEFQEFSMQGTTLAEPKRIHRFTNATNSPPIKVTIQEIKETK